MRKMSDVLVHGVVMPLKNRRSVTCNRTEIRLVVQSIPDMNDPKLYSSVQLLQRFHISEELNDRLPCRADTNDPALHVKYTTTVEHHQFVRIPRVVFDS